MIKSDQPGINLLFFIIIYAKHLVNSGSMNILQDLKVPESNTVKILPELQIVEWVISN